MEALPFLHRLYTCETKSNFLMVLTRHVTLPLRSVHSRQQHYLLETINTGRGIHPSRQGRALSFPGPFSPGNPFLSQKNPHR
jgi:hypothetical protein